MTTENYKTTRSIRDNRATIAVESFSGSTKLVTTIDETTLAIAVSPSAIDWIVRALTEAKAEMEAAK
jgi:ribose 5-phosphate isomerase